MKNLGVILVFVGIYLMWGAAGTNDYEWQMAMINHTKTTPTPMWVLTLTAFIGIVVAAVGVNIANRPN